VKLGDLVQVIGGLYGWGSPGVIIKLEPERFHNESETVIAVHILAPSGNIVRWYDFQLEATGEDG